MPLDGVAALDNSLDTGGQAFEPVTALGVQARFIQDLQLGLDVLGNVMEPYHAEKTFKERRIAWTDELGDLPVSVAVKAAIRQFVEMATHQGAQLERRALSGADLEKAWEVGGALAGVTDISSPSNMPRFFRRFFGARGQQEGPGAALLRGLSAAPETFRSREATERILFERRSIGAIFDRFLADWDVWICPTFPSAAALDEGAPGAERGQTPAGLKLDVDGHPVSQVAAGLGFNLLATLAGNPAVVIPLAQSKEGLPIGVQIVGRRGWETELLALADHLTEIGCGYLRPSAMT
ncbi:MAG TPA: amidase family protein [Anaerolineaceae bacterium]|nr:amidase family protein [Anaerolineaceae bacterium]